MDSIQNCQDLTSAIQRVFIDLRLVAHHKNPEAEPTNSSKIMFWNTSGDIGEVPISSNDVSKVSLSITAQNCNGVTLNEKFNKNKFQKRFQRFMREYTGVKDKYFSLGLALLKSSNAWLSHISFNASIKSWI